MGYAKENRLKINLERSGGILGSTSSRIIDTEKLSKSQVDELENLLADSNFFKLSSMRSKLASPKGAADYYNYNVTVEKEGKKHSVKCTDLSMTKELRQLISTLYQVKT